MATIEDDSTYSPDEVGRDFLGAHYRTVMGEIHAGRLFALKVGTKPIYRIPGWALRDYLAGRAPQPTSLVASVEPPTTETSCRRVGFTAAGTDLCPPGQELLWAPGGQGFTNNDGPTRVK